MDKQNMSIKAIEKAKFEKKLEKEVLKQKIDNLTEWIKLNEANYKQIEREMMIKMKAPLSLEPKFAYEQLPEWEEHLKESQRLAMTSEKLRLNAEMFDVKARLEQLNKQLEEIENE